jgi:phosphoribosylformylglycinamidine synthase
MTNHNWQFQTEQSLVENHGLKLDEFEKIVEGLGREPNLTELGIFSAMWNEHCSYKSSKFWLKKLPTSGERVVQGPGENAGVIDIDDGDVAVFKMESHNHPSFLEPYQGAATGVGGILRDVFTMGARPVANLNALRFGEPNHPKTKHLLSGVVSGIGGYGNCIGVPTVGGEVNFHPSYNGNILVNAMTVGIAKKDKIFYSAAAGIGNPVVYVGSKTGRDGIHGATMASAEFDEDSEDKKPTVQVGDPFTEKLLLEACLELMKEEAIIAIQDMGAAGLTSSSIEMASKGDVGLEIDLSKVPMRAQNMSAYELMLSESQERMLMVLDPLKEEMARDIFKKWDLEFEVIGKVTDTKRLILMMNGKEEASIPINILVEDAPEYQRDYIVEEPSPIKEYKSEDFDQDNILKDLNTMIMHPDLSSRKWIWEQYDHMVMADTVVRPGSDAAVVRVHGTNKGLAMSTDCSPVYCKHNPYEGGKHAVVETWRNIIASGALPIAITDCMNFGNPEKPEIMGQFVECIRGMGDACSKLNYPVVSGNVSLYNETNGEGIYPTPAIGGVGLIKDLSNVKTLSLKEDGNFLCVVGKTANHLGASKYISIIQSKEEGGTPEINLDTELRNGNFVMDAINQKLIASAHDVGEGGILVAISEMCMSGNLGITIEIETDFPHGYFFAEDQSRYLLEVSPNNYDECQKLANNNDVHFEKIGIVGGDKISIKNIGDQQVSVLKRSFETSIEQISH